MAKTINLEKEEMVVVLGNGIEITLTPKTDEEAIRMVFNSETGGRKLGVRQCTNQAGAMEVYLQPLPKVGFRLV